MKTSFWFFGVSLFLFSIQSAVADKVHVDGRKPARRFTTVVVEWVGNDARFHTAIDVGGSAEQSWRHAVNKCGGVSRNCHVLKSWGKYGCLVIHKGWSRRGNVWLGHSLALLPVTYGNGAMQSLLEDADERARDVCDFHAHYDERGKIYDPEMPFREGYCGRAKVVCSAPFKDGEYE